MIYPRGSTAHTYKQAFRYILIVIRFLMILFKGTIQLKTFLLTVLSISREIYQSKPESNKRCFIQQVFWILPALCLHRYFCMTFCCDSRLIRLLFVLFQKTIQPYEIKIAFCSYLLKIMRIYFFMLWPFIFADWFLQC